MPLLGVILGAYLLAAIPFSVWVARAKGVDLRKVGSGNLGATNVYRSLGIRYAAIVFALDVFKGFLPVYVSMWLWPAAYWAHVGVGVVCIIGHSWSVFVGFKGGKGAATGLGVLLALSEGVFLFLALVAALLIWRTRYVSVATLTCAVLAPILFIFFGYPLTYIVFVTVISILIIFRHRANIERLIEGRENRV